MNFYLPDFYHKFQLNKAIIEAKKDKPERFNEDTNIAGIYGCFPSQIWNGGRGVLGEVVLKDNVIGTIGYFNENNISIHLTYTNCHVEEKHVYDQYCNVITKLCNNGFNKIIVNSEILEKYIRETYPEYGIILSTTRQIGDTDQLNKLIDSYDLICPDYNLNNTEKIFELAHKDKYEILVDAYCADGCKARGSHYDVLSKDQMNFSSTDPFSPCKAQSNASFYDLINRKNFISLDKIREEYAPAGFDHFKLEGRNHSNFDVLESYLHYFVKPEYKDIVRLDILKSKYSDDIRIG